jgi:hypothetical protein
MKFEFWHVEIYTQIMKFEFWQHRLYCWDIQSIWNLNSDMLRYTQIMKFEFWQHKLYCWDITLQIMILNIWIMTCCWDITLKIMISNIWIMTCCWDIQRLWNLNSGMLLRYTKIMKFEFWHVVEIYKDYEIWILTCCWDIHGLWNLNSDNIDYIVEI